MIAESCPLLTMEGNLKQNKHKGGNINMYEYDEECLQTFLKKQSQLFEDPVAETLPEAEAFLEDCLAVVLENLNEVREYFEENSMDIGGMNDEELEEASEVFPLPSGQYLVVEG